jgi:hypothetical protein
MEEGKYHDVEAGTPQGGVISPVLANVYLHYVLDLWLERHVKPRCAGFVEMVRYADDFVICVQYKNDAEWIMNALKERLAKFNLELAEDKTRLIEFGRYSKGNAKAKGGRPAVFNFLGFTHFVDKTRTGGFKLGRRTDHKKFSSKLKELGEWFKGIRNIAPIKEIWKTFKAKLAGHFQYYGVSGNSAGISRYMSEAVRLARKWLDRRSQKKSFNWKSLNSYMERFPLPRPRIHHDFYTLKTMSVNMCEEPCAGKPQARFCEGYGISHYVNNTKGGY